MHNKNSCRVCGYDMKYPIWGEDGNTPSFDICPCCGTEFGYEDCTPQSINLAKKYSIDTEYKYNNTKEKLKD
ncbi:MAG: hypothetical protein WA933_22715 [Microcoleaceae cyanobacterium]